ncbi:MAG: type II toxin-antitoxin system Phd/YefM family antitoxin [Sphingomonas sp.]
MSVTIVSSREFNQDANGAKRAVQNGPVFITYRGRPTHVPLTIDEYRRLSASAAGIVDLIGMTATEATEFEPQALVGELCRPAELS